MHHVFAQCGLFVQLVDEVLHGEVLVNDVREIVVFYLAFELEFTGDGDNLLDVPFLEFEPEQDECHRKVKTSLVLWRELAFCRCRPLELVVDVIVEASAREVVDRD